MIFKWEWVETLAKGLPLTLQITFTCIAIGIVLGVLLALSKVYGNRALRIICSVYIQVFRGTPLLVQLFIVYYGFPNWGIKRGGQMFAARSLGMSLPQAIRYVILPQAFRLVLPSWSNEFILMLKYSSIVYTVTLLDLMGQGKRLASRNFNYFEVFIIVALFYLAIVFIVSTLLRLLERRVRIPGLGAPTEYR
jgi:polar amino acid transport system permease protein